MITTTIHAAAFVLPAFTAAAVSVAAFGVVMGSKVAVARPKSIDRQGIWFGTDLSTTGTSYVPQSRGSTG